MFAGVGSLAKLTLDDLRYQFGDLNMARYDHPGRKGFTLQPKKQYGVLYPNPPGCVGIRLAK